MWKFTNTTSLLARITDGSGNVTDVQPSSGVAFDPTSGPFTVSYIHVQAGG